MHEISTIVAARKNFRAMRGDTFGPVVLQFFTLVGNTETPIDITGDTFLMELKISREPDAATAMTFELGSGLTIQNTNELLMLKEPLDMIIEARSYVYDLQRTQLSGVVSTEMTGTFKIVNDISS
jgi:hypothetical protein